MILEDIKSTLRVTGKEFDNEILNLIEACKGDLETSGVTSSFFDKPLCVQAIHLYCKAYFGYDNAESEKYVKAYEHIKNKIAITYTQESERER